MTSCKPLISIPTHVFMGFLGSGKTSAILSLFEKKPANERWAVLVNEYGKLGIDGAHYQSQGVYVKEIPGGCMCCAAGVPMQVAINQLLKKVRPDRLLVETSGLGHPDGVLKTLNSEHFKKVLQLKASFCLLDPEKLLHPLVYANGLLERQVALADILIANKVDLASPPAMEAFDRLVSQCSIPKSIVAKTTFGSIDVRWLDEPVVQGRGKELISLGTDSIAEKDDVFVLSKAFDGNIVFSLPALKELFQETQPIRIKAICNTKEGWVLISGEQSRLTVSSIKKQQISRFDILLDSQRMQQTLEEALIRCTQ